MKLENTTPFEVAVQPMTGPEDGPVMAVIVKGTYQFDQDKTILSAEQMPIAYGDIFYDPRDGGGIRYESDIVPFKPCTDVVLSGKAHAPDNKPVTQLDVALRVGPVKKQLKVFGKRLWNHAGVLSRRYTITRPQPFIVCPIRYNRAFGGMDQSTGEFCEGNPAGKGFYSIKTKAKLAGRALPLIEDPGHLIRNPGDHPPPAGYGFYHRAWQPRAAHAGTYDETWRKERSPRPPKDFDPRFYNGAHPDLRAKGFLKGNEPVELIHLTPKGRERFNLPGVRPHCRVLRVDQPEPQPVALNLDTVFIEPDERAFCIVWRGNAPLAELSAAAIDQVSITL